MNNVPVKDVDAARERVRQGVLVQGVLVQGVLVDTDRALTRLFVYSKTIEGWNFWFRAINANFWANRNEQRPR